MVRLKQVMDDQRSPVEENAGDIVRMLGELWRANMLSKMRPGSGSAFGCMVFGATLRAYGVFADGLSARIP